MQATHEPASPRARRALSFSVPVALVRAHWPALLAAGITIAIGIPTLIYPYGPDQALFAYIGRRLTRGAALYTDVWDVKPPGIFLIYAAIELIPGPQVRLLRVVDLLYTSATVIAIYALARLYWDRLAAAVAGVLYGITYAIATGYWHTAQPDSFMVLPLICALIAFERSRRSGSAIPALLSGVLFGIAVQLRPTILLVPVALVILDVCGEYIAGGPRRKRVGAGGRRMLYLAAGGTAVQLLIMVWLLLRGSLGAFLYAQFDFASEYARLGGPYSPDGLTPGSYLAGLRSSTMYIVFTRLLLVAPAIAGAIIGGVIRRERPVIQMSVLAFAAFLSVAVQAKFFLYHWHGLLPFLALLSGWSAGYLWRSLRAARYSVKASAAALALAGALLLFLTPSVTDRAAREWDGFVRYWLEPEHRSAYYDRFGLYGRGTFSYRASDEVSSYLRSETHPGDTIFVWGYDPLLYSATGRDTPSRFTSFLPLMTTWTPQAWLDEFVDDLERREPAYIILQRNENARWITGHWIDPVDYVPLIPRFQSLLDTRYEFDRRIEDYLLFRHLGP
jgi:hypothetical protein